METINDLVSSPTSSTKLDDDATRFAEMILAKAKFHRILVESIGAREDRKKEKKRKEKSKKRKDDKKKRKSKKDKGKKEKRKVEEQSEEQKIGEMLEKIRLKKEKLKVRKDKEKKKKKSKKKKKKRSSKAKTINIDISDQESVQDSKPVSWWSLATEDYDDDDEEEKYEIKKTPIVSKTPRKKSKSKKGRRKKFIDQTEHSFTDQSASTADRSTSVTGHTARSSLASSQPSFSSPLVRKVSDLSDHAINSATVIWWDKVKEATPLTPKALPSRTPTTTPSMVPKKSVYPSFLLSPRSDNSESDYDDVSIFSEESLSEQILDDLSCILDCSDDSDNDDVEETPTSKRKSSRTLSSNSYDSSSICSGPFTPTSPIRKPRSSRGTLTDGCITPTTAKHSSSVKILSSRSLCSEKANENLCAISPSSLESPSAFLSPSPTSPRSRSNTKSRAEPTRNTPMAGTMQTEDSPIDNKNPIDGIISLPTAGLFGNRKKISPTKALESPSIDGIQPTPLAGLFGNTTRKAPNGLSLPTGVPLA